MERVINRSDLRSASLSPLLPSDEAATQRLKNLSNIDFVTEERASAPQDQVTSDAESLEFRLFNTSGPRVQSAGTQNVQKVRVRSPSADPATAGFVHADRPRNHYFASPPSVEEQMRTKKAVVSTAQVIAMSEIPWPGSTYEWKLQHVDRNGELVAPGQAPSGPNPKITVVRVVRAAKQCKLSKTARIRLRVRLLRLEAEKRAAETTEAGEREKKAKRNREKKLKKKAREKAKKAAGKGDADADTNSADSESNEG